MESSLVGHHEGMPAGPDPLLPRPGPHPGPPVAVRPAKRPDADATDAPHRPSGLEAALAQVGDRWSLLVVDALLDGPKRFGELQEALAGIATNVLTQRLRHLETSRVVVSRPYSNRPLRLAYELTAAGRELAGALRLLGQWGAQASAGGEAPVHAVCGTALQVAWWCPTCDLPVDDPDDDPLIWA
jgi:DNA-binding HxlR family transcriptional regulator